MSRGLIVFVIAAVVSVAWAAGFIAYAVAEQKRSTHLTAQYVFDRCVRPGASAVPCIEARDVYERHALDRLPWGTVIAVAAAPVPVIFIIAWVVVRLGRRRAAPGG
jgi:hypothetical protein